MNGYLERHADRLLASDEDYAIMRTVWYVRWLRKYELVSSRTGELLCCGNTMDDMRSRVESIVFSCRSRLIHGTNDTAAALGAALSSVRNAEAVKIESNGMRVTVTSEELVVRVPDLDLTCRRGLQTDIGPVQQLIELANDVLVTVGYQEKKLFRLINQVDGILKLYERTNK